MEWLACLRGCWAACVLELQISYWMIARLAGWGGLQQYVITGCLSGSLAQVWGTALGNGFAS